MNFGQLLKDLRIRKEETLRLCSANLKVDPSNWSKIERGVTPPPKDSQTLRLWASYFGLSGQDEQQFMDLAALARSEIPTDMASDKAVIEALPVFFRPVRGQELEGDKLRQFIEDLRKVHSPD